MGEFTIMGHEDTYIRALNAKDYRSYYIEYIDNLDIFKLASHSNTGGVLIGACFMAPDKQMWLST